MPVDDMRVRDMRSSSGWVPIIAPTHGTVALRLEQTDLVALLTSSLAPLVVQAREEQVELSVDALGDIPRVAIDREKIAWAVATLVGNALRYIVRGGPSEPARGILVHLIDDEIMHEVALSVHDDGPGVPAEKLPHLFVRRPGALHADGLALSLVRDIVGAHDGRLEVESHADGEVHGTSITIYLPSSRR